ncbi:MAG: hypothetical protein WBD20_01795 [Pirellulaceae bacterium]
MKYVELQSQKYLTDSPGQSLGKSSRRRYRSRRGSLGGMIFRCILIGGLVASVHWFYRNQDPILSNIRDNSGNYSVMFSNMVKHFTADNMNEFADTPPQDVK